MPLSCAITSPYLSLFPNFPGGRSHFSLLSGPSLNPAIDTFNSFFASGNFLLSVYKKENSLDPDQDRHSVGPDLNPNRLTLIVILSERIF